jgi:OOP family OmpA-OmpF porin
MRYFKITLFVYMCSFFYTESHAQEKNKPWLISVGINSVDNRIPTNIGGLFEDYFGLEEDQNVLLAISTFSASKYLKNGFSVGVNASINEIEKEFGKEEGDSEDFFFAAGVNLRYDVNELVGETGWFDPFVSLGVNYTSIEDDNDYRVGIGYGFHTWFNESLGLTFASSYNHNFERTGNDYFQHSLGVSFRFGVKDMDGDGVSDKKDTCPNEAGLLEFNGCPDTDGDGIVNADDACPNTAGSIDLRGCPDSDGDGVANAHDACPNAAGSMESNGCPDSDGDGVLDKNDFCVRQVGPVSNNGCPWPDTDGDGVLDKNDKCIDQFGLVSNQGCPESIIKATKKIIDFKKSISFDSGKSSFKSGVANELDSVAEIMKTFSGMNFKIKGHTDSVGATAFNLNLSKARASAVKEYLVSKGVDADRLYDEGFGKERPIASNNTAKERAMNRRVEIVAIK